jgi:hypothetical protein
MIKTVERLEKVQDVVSKTCDVCKKEYMDRQEDWVEMQEFHHIRLMGGYGSVFGDSCEWELDICQHCLKEKLGEYMRQKEE